MLAAASGFAFSSLHTMSGVCDKPLELRPSGRGCNGSCRHAAA